MTSKPKFKTMGAYIASFPNDVQVILEKIRQTIRRTAPDAVETISYQIPTFKLNGKYLVYLAAWKEHIEFYATSSGNAAFKEKISQFRVAKGSIRFPLKNRTLMIW
jgi:uncharacterized protein YdhG (YjbR/CyaY superfamily)